MAVLNRNATRYIYRYNNNTSEYAGEIENDFVIKGLNQTIGYILRLLAARRRNRRI